MPPARSQADRSLPVFSLRLPLEKRLRWLCLGILLPLIQYRILLSFCSDLRLHEGNNEVAYERRAFENKESGGRSKFHLRPIDLLKKGIYSFVTQIKIIVHIEETRERRTYTRRRMF